MEKPKVSIIIPAYNAENFIGICLNSILNQTYDNFEVIVVNDGSIDNTYGICKKYTEIDKRIKLISKENAGVGEARNTGIEYSTGDYILFIDSDDSIDKNYLEELINASLKYNADLTESGARVFLPGNEIIYPYQKQNNINTFAGEELIKNFLLFKTNISVWGKLYKKALIGDTRFKKLNINEDFFFTWEIIKKVKIYLEDLNVNYNYYLNKPDSLSKKAFSINNMTMLDYITTVLRDSLRMYPRLEEEARNHYSACLLHNLVLYYDYLVKNPENVEYVEEFKKMKDASIECIDIKTYILWSESIFTIEHMINDINAMIKERSR